VAAGGPTLLLTDPRHLTAAPVLFCGLLVATNTAVLVLLTVRPTREFFPGRTATHRGEAPRGCCTHRRRRLTSARTSRMAARMPGPQ